MVSRQLPKTAVLDAFLEFTLRSSRRVDSAIREFRDVVFEDVVFDNNSYVTPY